MGCGEHYAIRVIGHIDASWSPWFSGLVIVPCDDGQTELGGDLPDQAALHGVLARIRDLNLTLVSVIKHGREDSRTTEGR